MARGFLSGVIWGGMLGVAVAGVASLGAGLAPVPQLGEEPGRAEAPRETPAAEAAPTRDADLATDPATGVPEVPRRTAALDPASTASPARPETGQAGGLAPPPEAESGAEIAATRAGTPTASDAPGQPEAPPAEAEPSISTVPAQPPAPDPAPAGAFETPAPAPQIDAGRSPGTAAPQPGPAPAAPEPAQPPAPEAEAAPQPEAEAPEAEAALQPEAETPEAAPQPEAGTPEAEAALQPPPEDPAASQTAPAPSIGTPAISLIGRTEATSAPAPDGPPPIEAFAADFDDPEGRPLMAIVLIDDGSGPISGAPGLAALQSFPYPLSFAVDASLPDAAERAAAYRAQGLEVLALTEMPQGATASDVEVSLAAALDAVPEAIGVLEGTGAGLQSSREISDQVTAILAASGHGLLLQSKGLNTAQKLAVRDGVPAAPLFRDFDSAGQSPTVMRRFLDQAAFRAGQQAGVVMLGRVRADTISALLLWGLQDRAASIALVPVSAVMQAHLPEG